MKARRAIRRQNPGEREPAAAPPPPAPVDRILELQRSAGNAAVRTLLARNGTHAPAKKADAELDSAVRSFQKLAGVSHESAKEQVESAVEFLGLDGSALKRIVGELARVSKLKGPALYAAVVQIPAADMEGTWSFASSLGEHHLALTTAVRVVRDV